MSRVFVAAGSNIEPEKNLTLASQALRRAFPDIRFSPWYRNEAAGFSGEDFINFAVAFTTEQPVHEVIAKLRAIEELCGRPAGAPKWAPRSMDLDVLLFGDLIAPELKLPRPDLLKRAYMLGPLADLAPDVVHPTAGATIGALWQQFDRDAHPLIRIEPQPVP